MCVAKLVSAPEIRDFRAALQFIREDALQRTSGTDFVIDFSVIQFASVTSRGSASLADIALVSSRSLLSIPGINFPNHAFANGRRENPGNFQNEARELRMVWNAVFLRRLRPAEW